MASACSDPLRMPGVWSSWAAGGPRLPNSPVPAASSQVNSPVVILLTTAKMQCPLSVGLCVTHHLGFRGTGETWQGVRPQADQVDEGGKKPEVRVGMSGGAGISGAALTQQDLGAKDPELRQGRCQGSCSLVVQVQSRSAGVQAGCLAELPP